MEINDMDTGDLLELKAQIEIEVGKRLDSPAYFLPECVQTAFVFASRYVHHRNTGGTLAVCNALSYVWPQLSKQTQEQIFREVNEATTNLCEWREFVETNKKKYE